jgi:hypothetical protein
MESGPCEVSSSERGSSFDDEDEEESLEEKYRDVRAEVVKRVSSCDYMILERNGDYYVVEWMGGSDLDEGDRILGEVNRYGTKTCHNMSRNRESRLYIEDYRLSYSRAWDIIREKCDLDDDDERSPQPENR